MAYSEGFVGTTMLRPSAPNRWNTKTSVRPPVRERRRRSSGGSPAARVKDGSAAETTSVSAPSLRKSRRSNPQGSLIRLSSLPLELGRAEDEQRRLADPPVHRRVVESERLSRHAA